jgi:hypothetical protein
MSCFFRYKGERGSGAEGQSGKDSAERGMRLHRARIEPTPGPLATPPAPLTSPLAAPLRDALRDVLSRGRCPDLVWNAQLFMAYTIEML